MAAPAAAAVRRGGFAAGVLNSGLSVQYAAWPRLGLGAHVQATGGARAAGLRQTFYFDPAAARWNFYAGLEENFVDFDVDGADGKGWAAGGYLGGMYFFSPRWSAQMDLGPAYLSLEDDAAPVKDSGLEFVVNFGIHFHWGGHEENNRVDPVGRGAGGQRPRPRDHRLGK